MINTNNYKPEDIDSIVALCDDAIPGTNLKSGDILSREGDIFSMKEEKFGENYSSSKFISISFKLIAENCKSFSINTLSAEYEKNLTTKKTINLVPTKDKVIDSRIYNEDVEKDKYKNELREKISSLVAKIKEFQEQSTKEYISNKEIINGLICEVEEFKSSNGSYGRDKRLINNIKKLRDKYQLKIRKIINEEPSTAKHPNEEITVLSNAVYLLEKITNEYYSNN